MKQLTKTFAFLNKFKIKESTQTTTKGVDNDNLKTCENKFCLFLNKSLLPELVKFTSTF